MKKRIHVITICIIMLLTMAPAAAFAADNDAAVSNAADSAVESPIASDIASDTTINDTAAVTRQPVTQYQQAQRRPVTGLMTQEKAR